MLDGFSVVVPTYGQRLKGILRPTVGPRAGVLLLPNAGTHSAAIERIFTELEMYLQAAGVVTLRLSLPFDSSQRRRVSGVLGGVSLLRTMGARRVLIISAAMDSQATWEQAHTGTLAELVSLGKHGRELPDIVRILRDLTTTIRDVAECTMGVATVVVQPWRAPTAALPKQRQAPLPQRFLGQSALEGGESYDTDCAPPLALLQPMSVPRDPIAAERTAQRLIAQLYSWSLALAHVRVATEDALMVPLAVGSDVVVLGVAQSPVPAARSMAAIHANAQGLVHPTWLDQLHWTDEQWHALLRAFAGPSA